MRESDPKDPSLAMCQICERAYISKMCVPDKGNDGQIREYRTCALSSREIATITLPERE